MPSRIDAADPPAAAAALHHNHHRNHFGHHQPDLVLYRDAPAASAKRPSSAPGDTQNAAAAAAAAVYTNGVVDHEDRAVARPVKPLLLRSKSEHGLRTDDPASADQSDDELYEWGVRHGFEDHYQSEDIISQLANVRLCLLADRSSCVLLRPQRRRGHLALRAFFCAAAQWHRPQGGPVVSGESSSPPSGSRLAAQPVLRPLFPLPEPPELGEAVSLRICCQCATRRVSPAV